MSVKVNFSSFSLKDSLKKVQIEELLDWRVTESRIEPSDFFQERLRRLRHFDLTSSERAKELLIDAVCEEALERHTSLKIWKAAPLQGDDLVGVADYVVAPRRAYLETPLVCVVEAKKDDFEQGLAQCLVEMKACQVSNEEAGGLIDVYGVVTNGEGWKFYQFSVDGQVHQSVLYSLSDVAGLLGALHHIFSQCEANIVAFAQAA
jgi:hypothetical protein